MKVLVLSLIALCWLSLNVEGYEVKCHYTDVKNYGYKCQIRGSKIIASEDDRTITSVTGEHLNGKTDDDVMCFQSFGAFYNFFPLGLTDIFKNLEAVYIMRGNLTEIHSSDLQQFGEKLTKLNVNHNFIEVVEADLFQYNPNLEDIEIYDNKLRHIEVGAFGGLTNLKELELKRNPCINKNARRRNDVIALVSDAELSCTG